MKITAFYGSQGAGKSESAKALTTVGWVRLSFATPIYRMMSALLGVDARTLPKEEPLEELCGKTLREALQLLGTEFGRNMIGKTIWLDALLRDIRQAEAEGAEGVVIDDLRFANEYHFLRDLGATIIRIDRPDAANGTLNSHASECDWVDFRWDHRIHNDGDMLALREKIRKVLGV